MKCAMDKYARSFNEEVNVIQAVNELRSRHERETGMKPNALIMSRDMLAMFRGELLSMHNLSDTEEDSYKRLSEYNGMHIVMVARGDIMEVGNFEE